MTNEFPVGYLDNPQAPDFFAAEASGFFNLSGTIMITLETPHANHEITPGPVNRAVIGRLIMPASGAYNLAAGLFNFLKDQGFEFDQSATSGGKSN